MVRTLGGMWWPTGWWADDRVSARSLTSRSGRHRVAARIRTYTAERLSTDVQCSVQNKAGNTGRTSAGEPPMRVIVRTYNSQRAVRTTPVPAVTVMSAGALATAARRTGVRAAPMRQWQRTPTSSTQMQCPSRRQGSEIVVNGAYQTR